MLFVSFTCTTNVKCFSVPRPNMDKYVFLKVLENQEQVMIDPEYVPLFYIHLYNRNISVKEVMHCSQEWINEARYYKINFIFGFTLLSLGKSQVCHIFIPFLYYFDWLNTPSRSRLTIMNTCIQFMLQSHEKGGRNPITHGYTFFNICNTTNVALQSLNDVATYWHRDKLLLPFNKLNGINVIHVYIIISLPAIRHIKLWRSPSIHFNFLLEL